MREQASKLYGVLPYYLGKMIVEAPVQALCPLLFSIVVYFGVGTTVTPQQFFIFYFVLFCISFCGVGCGYFLSSVFSKPENAIAASPNLLMPFMLFAGLLVNSNHYPAWISWFQYTSPIRYALEALVRNEFEARDFNIMDKNPI